MLFVGLQLVLAQYSPDNIYIAEKPTTWAIEWCPVYSSLNFLSILKMVLTFTLDEIGKGIPLQYLFLFSCQPFWLQDGKKKVQVYTKEEWGAEEVPQRAHTDGTTSCVHTAGCGSSELGHLFRIQAQC